MIIYAILAAGILCLCAIGVLYSQTSADSKLDAQVSVFLDNARGSWSGWNISYEDGKVLYMLVLKGKYKNIVEIGTSTGHSTIWLAWAAAKTGGKVITIEIDRGRYNTALENFKKAGVSDYIDVRLGDAHDIVPLIKGPVDFVFCDADKDWYVKYFQILEPKISINGCFTAHNVLWAGQSNINQFLEYLKRNSGFRTYIEKGSGEGISVSCRIKE
ncbi:MAG: class I SAM-dependent methyltransferase [Spirochaetes bacterium]|nr:class I SAM-dependent methyltransferase [Spirochaetota bacterium]